MTVPCPIHSSLDKLTSQFIRSEFDSLDITAMKKRAKWFQRKKKKNTRNKEWGNSFNAKTALFIQAGGWTDEKSNVGHGTVNLATHNI